MRGVAAGSGRLEYLSPQRRVARPVVSALPVLCCSKRRVVRTCTWRLGCRNGEPPPSCARDRSPFHRLRPQDVAYDATKDPIMKRVLQMLGEA